jgi:hypothetical protein
MRRTAPLVVAAALLAGLIAGCGQASDSATPDAPPLAPVLPHYTTVAQLAAAVAARRDVDRFVALHLTGITTDSPPQSTAGDGIVSFAPDGPTLQVRQSDQALDESPGPPFTLLIQPSQALLRPPAGTVSIPPGKSWFTVRQDPSNAALTKFNQIVQALRDSADPTRALAGLGDAARITSATDDTLDGIPSVRYAISLDLTVAAQRQGNPAVLRALADAVASGGSSTDTTLWLDAANQPLRTVLSRTISANDGTHSTYVMTVRYHDWGEPVAIPIPPPAQVVGR